MTTRRSCSIKGKTPHKHVIRSNNDDETVIIKTAPRWYRDGCSGLAGIRSGAGYSTLLAALRADRRVTVHLNEKLQYHFSGYCIRATC